jgi:hypothetical protein
MTKTNDAESILLDSLARAKAALGPLLPRLVTERPQPQMNALRHGLTGQTLYLPPDELADYLQLGAQLMLELRPLSVMEMQDAQGIIDTRWRLIRARALDETLFNCEVAMEKDLLRAANPQISPKTLECNAQSSATKKLSLGGNAHEKLRRHETRLARSLREQRSDYKEACLDHPEARRKEVYDSKQSEAYKWYKELSDLARKLYYAREELAKKSVEETTQVDANLQPITTTDSTAISFCKKTMRLLQPLKLETEKLLDECYGEGLLTDEENTMYPFQRVA